jgi:hypothetical protein
MSPASTKISGLSTETTVASTSPACWPAVRTARDRVGVAALHEPQQVGGVRRLPPLHLRAPLRERAHDRPRRDDGGQAADRAAPAAGRVAVHPDVPDVARAAVDAAEQPPLHDDPGPRRAVHLDQHQGGRAGQ